MFLTNVTAKNLPNNKPPEYFLPLKKYDQIARFCIEKQAIYDLTKKFLQDEDFVSQIIFVIIKADCKFDTTFNTKRFTFLVTSGRLAVKKYIRQYCKNMRQNYSFQENIGKSDKQLTESMEYIMSLCKQANLTPIEEEIIEKNIINGYHLKAIAEAENIPVYEIYERKRKALAKLKAVVEI